MPTCKACGAELSSDAQFCHRCGRRVSAVDARANPWSIAIPWAAVGAAVGVAVTLFVLRGSPPQTAAPLPSPSTSAGDISRMSPDERATRLFNRVMRLDEEGKADSVAFFAPMALQAYDMLSSRDADARFHVALLQLAAGNPAGAQAQADSIGRVAPEHLFRFMILARVAHARGDATAERRAVTEFKRHEQAERNRGRPEYQDHSGQLDAFAKTPSP